MFKSLTYVSLRSTSRSDGKADMQAILSVSHVRNPALGITGALVSACETFAQFIEGPPDSVDALMDSIGRDARHKAVKIVSVRRNDRRRFPKWALAYCGDAHYIDRHIKRLLISSTGGAHAQQVAQLQSLMDEFSKRVD